MDLLSQQQKEFQVGSLGRGVSLQKLCRAYQGLVLEFLYKAYKASVKA